MVCKPLRSSSSKLAISNRRQPVLQDQHGPTFRVQVQDTRKPPTYVERHHNFRLRIGIAGYVIRPGVHIADDDPVGGLFGAFRG
jgi:hypothetical protein